jgi:hypothetical protein
MTMNKTIASRQTYNKKDVKIATLRGKEAQDVWKALGKDGLVYNTVEDKDGFRLDMYRSV